jgi:hypothetical protein
MTRILIFIVFAIISLNSIAQTFWKIENEYGDEILLTIEINKEKNTFEAFTRKEALKDIAGTFTWTLAKTAGKLKYPEIVFIEGKTQNRKDTTILTGIFTYFDKQFPFSASIFKNQFKGFYTDRNRSKVLTGTKLLVYKPIKDYKNIINTSFTLAEKNLANPSWVKSDEWEEFREKINELKPKIADDYEMAASIEWNGKKLPFSPFEISKINPRTKTTGAKNASSFRELNSKTVLFDANSVPATKTAFDSIAVIIGKKGYENMILDLRGRTSINPAAANFFANFISKKTFTAGVFLTRKWFDSNPSVPEMKDYEKLLKSFGETGYRANSINTEKGRTFKIVAAQNPFKGKVFVITDSRTSKVSEVLVHILKTEKMAVVVGQKTNGSAFLVERLPITAEFELILPVAEFYTAGGKPFEKNGIEPDKPVSNEDVLQYVLKNMIK